jgi:hypothetical protein
MRAAFFKKSQKAESTQNPPERERNVAFREVLNFRVSMNVGTLFADVTIVAVFPPELHNRRDQGNLKRRDVEQLSLLLM